MKDDTVYIDGKIVPHAKTAQHNYYIQTDGTVIASSVFDELGISKSDYMGVDNYGQPIPIYQDLTNVDSLSAVQLGLKQHNGSFGKLYGPLPMTDEMVEKMKAKPFVLTIIKKRNNPERVTIIRWIMKPAGRAIRMARFGYRKRRNNYF